MTIDETIENEKELSEHCKRMFEEMSTEDKLANKLLKREIQYHEQLAEWLEELKAYREIGTVEECKGCVLEILKAYNKAIDDFEQKILEKAPRNYAGDLELGGSVSFLSANAVTKIAEQLKVGEAK